jgi:hypothetical protein
MVPARLYFVQLPRKSGHSSGTVMPDVEANAPVSLAPPAVAPTRCSGSPAQTRSRAEAGQSTSHKGRTRSMMIDPTVVRVSIQPCKAAIGFRDSPTNGTCFKSGLLQKAVPKNGTGSSAGGKALEPHSGVYHGGMIRRANVRGIAVVPCDTCVRSPRGRQAPPCRTKTRTPLPSTRRRSQWVWA